MKPRLLVLFSLASLATFAAEPWRFTLLDKKANINVALDLYDETIEVPGMELFGPTHGYLQGPGLYGTWTVTSSKIISPREATLRASNDMGSETQEIRLAYTSDSTLTLRLTGPTVMKKVVSGRKLVKIEPVIMLQR